MAKKRYHQGRGMEAGMVHEGRIAEREGESMLREDHSAIANMPQEVKYHKWATAEYGLNPAIDDTGVGIDRQEMGDYSQMKRHFKPRKA